MLCGHNLRSTWLGAVLCVVIAGFLWSSREPLTVLDHKEQHMTDAHLRDMSEISLFIVVVTFVPNLLQTVSSLS